MPTRMDPWLLWLRASFVGFLAVVFGVLGHVTADGLLPGPMVLLALLALAVALSGPMLNRPASRLRLMAMLVGGQAFVHLVLTVTAGHRGDPTPVMATPSPGPRSLPVMDGRRVGSLQDAYQAMPGQSSSVSPGSSVGHLVQDMTAHAPMMVVHLVAAALVGLWLARGERCLWTVLALTGRPLVAAVQLLSLVPDAPRTRAVEPAGRAPVVPVSRWQAGPLSRRGPPLLTA